MNGYKKTLLGVTAVLFGLVVAIPQALAVPMLELSTSGGASAVVTDTDNDGVVSFAGSLGSFYFTFTSGVTKPAIGTPLDPLLDILSLSATAVASGETLTIKFSEDGFTGPVSGFAGQLTGHMLSGAPFAVTYQGLIDNTSLGSSAVPGINQSFMSGPIITPSSYSLTQIVTLKATGASGGTISLDASMVSTPEPATIFLLGSGLLGLGVWRLRKSQT